MIKFSEVQVGDYMMGEFEGKMWEGEVTQLNGDEKQVCLETSVQEFWFLTDHIYPIILDEKALLNLNFIKQQNVDGTIKYLKGSFRIVTAKQDDFSSIEMWYREDKRHHPDVHYVHQLQNQYHDMTKIFLTKNPM